jgi:hypothetical protein
VAATANALALHRPEPQRRCSANSWLPGRDELDSVCEVPREELRQFGDLDGAVRSAEVQFAHELNR